MEQVRETKQAIAAMSYEEAMERLEQVLQQLDNGSLPLEEAMACFQDGLDYISVCQTRLARAEQSLQILRDGAFTELDNRL